ncbi:MAG: hypothetical protein JJ938_09020 [Roseicyclus sp.]|nr:hypothetical protein [Roseicyclus sp.]MBO6625008.1 hypothetical protein [Roseicyclus sp.]
MMEVSFQKCSPTHPLVVQAPLADVRAPFIGAWLWQTCQDGDLLDDVDGRPTKAECGACFDVLLGLGRISFLSESRSDFSGEQYEQVDGFGGKTYRRHFPAFSRWTLPALVSTRCRDASPDLFFAFGNWSLGTQALLLMTGSSRPDHVERDLLMRVNSGRAPKDDIPNLLARLVPMVDGCGLIAMSSASKVIDDLSSAFTSGPR